MKLKPEAARQIRSTRRSLRRQKRGKTGAAYERHWIGLKGLTELQADPLRPGLAVQVAMNVRRAI